MTHPKSVGRFFTCDQLVAETSTSQQRTLTTDGYQSPLQDSKNYICFFSVAHRVSDLKISGTMTFCPFTKGFMNGPLQWFLWQMASNRRQLRAISCFISLTDVPHIFG